MTRPKVVGTGPVDQAAEQILSECGDFVLTPDYTEDTLVGMLDGTIGLVVRGEGVANARVIEAGKDLKVIGRSGVGYDMVDIAAATKRKIPVVYTPGQGARAVAEASITFMLCLCKNIFYWDRELKKGNWDSRHQGFTEDLDGATLGIVGFGAIGQQVAEFAGPFNMTILAYDPFGSEERAKELNVDLVELDELLKRSKFISLHCPLIDETRGMINRDRLKLVQPGSYLINLARGGVIESIDIVYEALQNGTLAGVALDVFEPEPPNISHPIFHLPNCVTTPHALGMSKGAMARIFKSMAEDMVAVIKGDRPRFVVNPEVFE